MKVVHLVPAMEQGGVETVVLSLNRLAVESGWESVVVSKGGRLIPQIEQAGGRSVTLDVKSKNPLTYFARAWSLRRVLQRERPDLVCVHSRVPAWLFVWANRPLGLKWLTYAHGANSISRYSAVMTRGNLTVTPSRFLADYLKSNYGLDEGRLRIIPPAVDETRFNPSKVDAAVVAERRRAWGLGPDERVIMAVGRITPLKGYDGLIRAVARLKERGWDVRLVLVGDADAHHRSHLDDLRRLAGELGLGERVIFAGGESHVPECLTLASVVVSANVRKPETFGLSMAEALAMECPVVAKRFGGAMEIVRSGRDGELVEGDDFVPALERALAGGYTGLRDGVLGRFGRDRMAERTLSVYNEILAGGQAE